jgi:hypothetical protein
MRAIINLGVLVGLGSVAGLAETWQGFLVDAKCYGAEQRNVNPTDTSTAVDVDKNQMIRYCSPKAKTKSFAIVRQNGDVDQLGSAGSAKASELVSKTGRRPMFEVRLAGELKDHTIKVDSISAVR